MKFIAAKIHWVGILMLAGFTTAAGVLYFDTPSKPAKKRVADTTATEHIHAAASADHAGCNHGAPQAAGTSSGCTSHSGCGSSETKEKSEGCCGGKAAPQKMALPPGHPPIEGYTVAADPHAGCSHGAAKPDSTPAAHP
ncbi:MAG TPA: hypothetical protein VEH04_11790 [Verrucomicrobiae bacterium]|nr:hypothetical protein [Verrucomicrobiae bacterium]